MGHKVIVKNLSFLVVWLVPLLISSCSINRFGVSASSGVIKQASAELETESDWDMFQKSAPGMIKLIEGLWAVDPHNENLLAALTKGYAAYAYGVSETLYLSEKFGDESAGPLKAQTIHGYTKALYYGMEYLAQKGITYNDILAASAKGQLAQLLNARLNTGNESDIETLLYTVQAWASSINLQKNNAALLAQLDLVKTLADFGCRVRENFQSGFCEVFMASYEASRPKALGGDPHKAQQLFVAGLKKYPDSIMVRVAYVERFLIPQLRQDEYQLQKPIIMKLIKERGAKPFVPGEPLPGDTMAVKGALLEAIASKRMQIIAQHEKSLF